MNFDQQSFSCPTLKKDQRLNHPVLSFKNKADLEFVFNQIQTNIEFRLLMELKRKVTVIPILGD